MQKLAFFAIFAFFYSTHSLLAQPSPNVSGIYEGLTLGVDAAQGTVTGYYKEVYEPPNMPHLECSFYLAGNKQGGGYAIRAWSADGKKNRVIAGELSFFSDGNRKPSVLLKLEESPDRDCTALKPNLAKGQGVYFDLKKGGAWSEVRVVARSKSPYYQAPDPSSPTRDSAKRGTVLTITERRSEWLQVQSDQKPKGWIRESDLFPTDPSREPAPPTASITEPPPSAPAKADLGAPPAPQPAPARDTRVALTERLEALNAQAFDMALQAQKKPAARSALAARRIEMEKELNALVSRLNALFPATYVERSKEIFEAYLDLRYVAQEGPVVSLRLNSVIRGE